MTVILCGLGPGGIESVTLGALEAMQTHRTFLRTGRHGAAEALAQRGVVFETLDDLYETCPDFDALCGALCDRIYAAAKQEDVVYAVSSGAGFCDATIGALSAFLKKKGVDVQVLPGVGYAEHAALCAGGLDGAVISSAQNFDPKWINTRIPLVLTELDNRLLAGEVKLRLLSRYPEDHSVLLVEGNEVTQTPLFRLDRLERYSHLLCAVLGPVDILALSRYDFTRLLDIAAILRGQSDRFPGCPWDMEQTHLSMRASMIEEVYEAADAIDRDDPDQLCDELGDVLLQVVLHAQVAAEYDEFDACDVVTAVCRKMIRRHPHVFGSVCVRDSAQVLENWDKIKQTEQTTGQQTLQSVPRALPALIRANKVLKKAGDPPIGLEALRAAAQGETLTAHSAGQALLALVSLCRRAHLDGEEALTRAVDAWIAAYEKSEAPAQ